MDGVEVGLDHTAVLKTIELYYDSKKKQKWMFEGMLTCYQVDQENRK